MEEPLTERRVLVVEANPEHVRVIQRAFAEDSVNCQIMAIDNGAEAMNFLRRQEPHASAPRPDLLLLDLDLPGKNGHELLAAIKADPKLKRIPIIVLTLSANEADIVNSYALQGNCYVIKSSDLEQLHKIVKRIEEFWLGIVTLPVD